MIWPKIHCVSLRLAVAAGLVLLSCGGCAQVMSPFLARSPSKTGTWTGRLVSVTTRCADEVYRAVAIDVETGPRSLGAGVDRSTFPGRDVVLLCRGQGIIDPEELGVPVGSRVGVRGTMRGGSPIKMVEQIDNTGGLMKSVRIDSDTGNPSVFIDIGRATPKLLK